MYVGLNIPFHFKSNSNNRKYWLDYISFQLNLHCHLLLYNVLLYDSEVSKDHTCHEKSYKILSVFISTNSRMHHFSMSLLGSSSRTEGWTELSWPKEGAHTKVVTPELPTATLWWWTNKQLPAVFKNKLHISKWNFHDQLTPSVTKARKGLSVKCLFIT